MDHPRTPGDRPAVRHEMIQSAAAVTEIRLLLIGRGLRGFVDGYVAVLLPAYLLALGYGTWQVGLLSTATLLGSALATLTLGAWGHRASQRLLLLGAALLMDVPTRSAYVMAVVTPPERAAAASFTAVPRSLAAALSPSLGGVLFATGWLAAPLVVCGCLKIVYDLALWRAFRKHPGA